MRSFWYIVLSSIDLMNFKNSTEWFIAFVISSNNWNSIEFYFEGGFVHSDHSNEIKQMIFRGSELRFTQMPEYQYFLNAIVFIFLFSSEKKGEERITRLNHWGSLSKSLNSHIKMNCKLLYTHKCLFSYWFGCCCSFSIKSKLSIS